MTIEVSQLHVVFGRSAAGSLQDALETAGRQGTVVSPYDDFSFGPIDFDDASTRAQWVEEELGYGDWLDIYDSSLPSVTESLNAELPPIVWFAPDCTTSAMGFLWWLSQVGHLGCSILEVPKLSQLNPQRLIKHLGREVPLSSVKRTESLALWSRLKAENAPIRVLGGSGLKSASIDYFDDALIANVTSRWRKMALIVAHTLIGFDETGLYQTGDLVLGARLAALAEAGVLEWRGDLNNMRLCELRLPAKNAAVLGIR